MKILSIIIPLYNSAQWLEKCLLSVLNQDIPAEEMEIICVNDGSPDHSAEIARTIAKQNPSIVVIDQENQGPSGARNTGMKAAKGTYLIFVDPDDYVEPNTFGGLVQQMEAEQLDMLRFDYRIVDEHDQLVEKRPFERAFDYTPQLMTGTEFLANRLDIACNIWRYIYRREIITKNQIWCFTGDYFDDTPWLPLVLMKAQRMNVCNTVVYDYYERQDGLVRAKSKEMVLKRTNGALLLLSLLKDQLDKLDGLIPVNTSDEIIQNVRRWYQMMMTHIYVGVLTTVGIHFYSQRENYLHRLNEWITFPLSNYRIESKMHRKLRLIRFNPNLFMMLVRVKNKV